MVRVRSESSGDRRRTGRVLLAACAGASLLAAACSGGEPPRSADRSAERVAVARSDAAAGRSFDSAKLSGAVLRDADLEAMAPSLARRPAPAPVIVDAPLPASVARVLEGRTSVAALDDELSITAGDRRKEILRAALDGASVLDDPLPPAAPLPDFP